MLGLLMAITMVGDAPYAVIPNWHVYRNEGTCSTITGKNTDVGTIALALTYDARLHVVKVYFGDPSVKALKIGDTQKLDIVLSKGTTFVPGWAGKDFTYDVDADGLGAFSTVLDDEILSDISASPVIGFFYGKVLLQGFDLEGSSRAIAKLRECADDESFKHPSDPFK